MSIRLPLPAMLAALLAALFFMYAVAAWRMGYDWNEMDWNGNGHTSIGEFLHSRDVGNRVVQQGGAFVVSFDSAEVEGRSTQDLVRDVTQYLAEALIEGTKADLLVLPELFNTGYLITSKEEIGALAEEAPGGKTAQRLAARRIVRETVVVVRVERPRSTLVSYEAYDLPNAREGSVRTRSCFVPEGSTPDRSRAGRRVQSGERPSRLAVPVARPVGPILPPAAAHATTAGRAAIRRPCSAPLFFPGARR